MHAKPRKKRWSKDDTELFLLSLPTLLWFLIFSYLPMFGIIIAFKVYKLSPGGHGFIYNLLHSEWAGFGNFKYFFTSNSFSMLLFTVGLMERQIKRSCNTAFNVLMCF